MRTSWLIVLALLVAGLATLFATTMTRLAGLQGDTQTVVTSPPVQLAAPPTASTAPGLEPQEPASAGTSTGVAPPGGPAPAAPQAGASSGNGGSPPPSPIAPSTTPLTEPSSTAQAPPNTPTSPPLAAPTTPPTTTPPTAPAPARQLRPVAAVPTGPGATTALDARSARCRALTDYLRDLDGEAARGPEPGRQVWLVEQRNTVRERQTELGC